MSQIRHYISAGCIAFTFSCIFYLLFSFLNIFPPMDVEMIVSMLVISTVIICLIFLTHLLRIQNPYLLRLLELLDVLSVLLVCGLYFDMFPFNWYYITFVLTTGLLSYIVVIIVSIKNNQLSAIQINTIIAGGKRGVSNKQDN